MRAQGRFTNMRSSLAGTALSLALGSLVGAVGLPQQASAAEPDEIGAGAGSTGPQQVVSTDSICAALVSAATQNDLPTNFFARLIWQESRFDPAAVSRAGAQGVAQFMPATANWRGLSNAFDPLEAIAQSAKLLRDMRREFGNLGLAAAAYNAAPGEYATGSPAGARSLGRQALMCASSPATRRSNGPARGQTSVRCSRRCPSRVARLPGWPRIYLRLQASRYLSGAWNWWEAQLTRLPLPPIGDWSKNTLPCWAVAKPTSFTMDWGAAPWVGRTSASVPRTVKAPGNYVPTCLALA